MKEYLEALDNVTDYNGLAPVVFKWYFLTSDSEYCKDYCIPCPHDYADDDPEFWSDQQLQVLWMIAVSMFGEWGTSPRFGWIEKEREAAFKQWVLDITWSWRASDEYNGPEEYRVNENVEDAPWLRKENESVDSY